MTNLAVSQAGRAAARSLPLPSNAPRIRLGVDERPRLFVVIDTEEEFDWNAPYLRSNTHVRAMRHIGRVQRIFDRFTITPTYVIDYPVASQPDGYGPLLDSARAGRCEIGAHLHPWVTPPDEEALTTANSFTSNLPATLQRRKIEVLRGQIQTVFGAPPRTFKAGRYGLDATTADILDAHGFDFDVSVCPRFDFSRDGGPSFAAFDALPFFITDRLMEIPCTVDYTGWAGSLRPLLHRTASRPALAACRAVGVLAKAGAVNQIMLSPEGNTFDEMRTLTNSLYARGQRTFMLSFHSPSVDPGHTPYVRTQADLDRFLSDVERYCEFFLGTRGGVATTPREFRATFCHKEPE